MFWKDVAIWLYFTIMKLSSHYLKHLIIHFYPAYCYCVFLGWMVLYWVYIWNSLYAQFSHPQLGNNLKVFYWKKCFMASSDAISTGLHWSFSNCDPQESLKAPHTTHIIFLSIFLHPVPHLHSSILTVAYTREFQIKFHFKKKLHY